LKCSNYTTTCFEPLIGSSSGRVKISQTTETQSNNMNPKSGCCCIKYIDWAGKISIRLGYVGTRRYVRGSRCVHVVGL
jgi:hypothetical protein